MSLIRRLSAAGLAGATLCALLFAASAAAGPAEETGKELWVNRYDPITRNAAGLDVLVSPEGDVLYAVGATSEGDDASFYRIVAFDPATGIELWSAERPGGVRTAALSADGSRIYLAGTVRSDDVTYHDWSVIALDSANGEELWSTVHPSPGRRDHANDIAVSPDGALVHVAGRVMERKRRAHDFAVVTFDAETGHEVWDDVHDGPDGRHDEALSIAVDPGTGQVYATGIVALGETERFGFADTAYATTSYDPLDGDRRWTRRYDGPGREISSDIPEAIIVDEDVVYVTGQSTSRDDDPDWLTAAYRARDGNKVWIARYNRAEGSEDAPKAMAIGPSGGRIYVTGSSGVRQISGATVAYRTRNGSRAWVTRFGPPSRFDLAWDVVASPDGERVYVAGTSIFDASEGEDFVTFGYSAHDGDVEWSARYVGSGAESVPSVAVQPDSARVFVTGREFESGNIVFTTLAYEPTS